MRKIIKTLLLVLVLTLAISALAACDFVTKNTTGTTEPEVPVACEHEGEATCTAAAVCTKCGESFGEALGHKGGKATCTAAAVCDVCGESYGEVDAMAHSNVEYYGDEYFCDKEGLSSGSSCLDCGAVIRTRFPLAPLGHDMVDATCTEAAYCQREGCGYTEGEALGHDMAEATCEEPATCKNGCGYTEGEALGHTMVDVEAKAVTCTEDGYTAHKACACGHTEGKEVIASEGHDYVYGICSVCQEKDPAYVDYYLVGYINGADYGCEADYANLGEYKFVDGKLTATFQQDSYIFVKSGNLNGENVKWYLAESYVEDGNGKVTTLIENKSEKIKVPANTEINFTLTVNEDGTLGILVEFHVHAYTVDVEAKAPTCTVDGYTAHKACECGDTQGKETVEATGHADESGDYKCDVCSATVLPADGTALTVEQALTIAKMQSHNTYTTQKYYITGIVTNVYNTTYGNLYLKDADGNQICIYGLYTWDKAVRYDKMDYKPVEGDELTVYTALGMYNSTAQGKDAWMDEVVAHAHDYESVVTDPGCLTEGYTTHTCSICKDSYVDTKVEALGHTTESGECERCGLTIGGDAPVVGTLATFDFGANGSAAHVDGNDYGTSKSWTVGDYTLSLTGMSKVYGTAYDAKGNSCIKLGTSKLVGTFSFTVPENVTEVVIYVAKYKSNATTIQVNGTSYTLTKNSNDGAYDVITIDTTTTKTVTLTTVASTYRAMVNTIVFNGTAQ